MNDEMRTVQGTPRSAQLGQDVVEKVGSRQAGGSFPSSAKHRKHHWLETGYRARE